MKKIILLVALSLLFGFTKAPKNIDNICSIFQTNPNWYFKAKNTEKKWGVPVHIQMAIIHAESRFNGEAKAKSSAYGFSQALIGTWRSYQKSTGAKGRRNEFAAATDFIGWYTHMTKKNLGISPKNTYALYLAYHEGLGGYKSKSYHKKPLIVRYAQKVHKKAATFESQLAMCRSQIEKLG